MTDFHRDLSLLALVEGIVSLAKKSSYVDELGRRLREDRDLRQYLDAYHPHAAFPTAQPQQVPIDLDPNPVDMLVDRMLASGWDCATREKTGDEVRGFFDSIRGLSELEMSIPQRRYWGAIKSAYRAFKTGPRPQI